MSVTLSAYEATANAIIGLAVSALAVQFVFPLFGWAVTPPKALGVATFFFCLSWARSFVLRRLFARLQ